MDANNLLDVIDYWNLRASGWNVIPIAKQISSSDIAKSIARSFVATSQALTNVFTGEVGKKFTPEFVLA